MAMTLEERDPNCPLLTVKGLLTMVDTPIKLTVVEAGLQGKIRYRRVNLYDDDLDAYHDHIVNGIRPSYDVKDENTWQGVLEVVAVTPRLVDKDNLMNRENRYKTVKQVLLDNTDKKVIVYVGDPQIPMRKIAHVLPDGCTSSPFDLCSIKAYTFGRYMDDEGSWDSIFIYI